MLRYIWVQQNQYDALGRCLELTEVTKYYLYYTKFDGTSSKVVCISRSEMISGEPTTKYFETQQKLKDFAVERLQSRLDQITVNEKRGWYQGYKGVK